MNIDSDKLKKLALAVIDTELEAINQLKTRINDDFVRACEYLLQCEGRIVVIGMGKSGHIGSKIAATLASTGSPAFFCPSRRSQSWRSRHDYQQRCGVGLIKLW